MFVKKESDDKKKCFVITPIGNAEDPIRRHIDGIINAAIKPVLEDSYSINVAHEMNYIGSINKQIIEEIFYSDLVIANLTNRNPNVMYELALRHCLGKPVIQIMEKGTILPFDIGTERTIEYQNDSQGVLELREEINKYIKNINFDDNRQGPIYDVLKSIKYEDNIFKEIDNQAIVNLDTDVLKYLLNRIDTIDSKMNRSLLMEKKTIDTSSLKFFIKDAYKYKDININRNIVTRIFDLNDNYIEPVTGAVSFPDNNLEIKIRHINFDKDKYINLVTNILKEHEIEVLSILEEMV